MKDCGCLDAAESRTTASRACSRRSRRWVTTFCCASGSRSLFAEVVRSCKKMLEETGAACDILLWCAVRNIGNMFAATGVAKGYQ